MKKLRLFDSLKLVLVTVACIFMLNVAHADTTAIQSVVAYGKTEQNGTPTPTNPVPIMTNNGVLKASKNLFNINDMQILGRAYTVTKNGNNIVATAQAGTVTASRVDFFIPVSVFKPNTTYYLRTKSNVALTGNQCNIGKATQQSSTGNAYYASLRTKENGGWSGAFTITDIDPNQEYVSFFYYLGAQTEGTVITISDIMITEGSTATTGVVANGLTETIRDAAGHKATTQMLLSVGDYKDEQNINTGAITRRVGVKVLDGTEDWITTSTYGADVFIANGFLPDSRRISANSGSILFSTHFAPAPISGAASTPKVNNTMSINSEYHGEGVVWIRSNNFSTVAQFKQWLADQYAAGTPVIVVYPLNASAQTTENIATQSLTTAPVRQTLGAIMNMPIKTILTDNSEIMSGANELIKIATTKYNEESFTDVQDALTGVFNAVDTVVSQTMTQAQQIDQIATNKQTRPDEECTAKYCLLIEDEDGTPHWYPIAGANGVAHNMPAGYTELQYLQSSGTQNIITDLTGFDTGNWEIYTKFMSTSETQTSYGYIVSVYNGESTNTYRVIFRETDGQRFILSGNNKAGAGNITVVGEVNRVYEATVKNGSVVFDGVTYETPTQGTALANNVPLTIFGGVNGNPRAKARIYSVKATQDGVLRANYIPAKRDSDNALGMYDMVSGTFYTNAGTGDFTAGPDM